MTLRVLDLFSGIGGFSYAFKSIAKTVGYCDIDPICQKILTANIQKNNLENAPIFDDVSKLTLTEINKLSPNMITAGFPCQDVSVANPNGLGMKKVKKHLYSNTYCD